VKKAEVASNLEKILEAVGSSSKEKYKIESVSDDNKKNNLNE